MHRHRRPQAAHSTSVYTKGFPVRFTISAVKCGSTLSKMREHTQPQANHLAASESHIDVLQLCHGAIVRHSEHAVGAKRHDASIRRLRARHNLAAPAGELIARIRNSSGKERWNQRLLGRALCKILTALVKTTGNKSRSSDSAALHGFSTAVLEPRARDTRAVSSASGVSSASVGNGNAGTSLLARDERN